MEIPFEVSKHLRISQEFSKVYVEHVPRGLKHDVVIVAIANTKDVGCHTVSGTGCCNSKFLVKKSMNNFICIPVKLLTAISYSSADGLCLANHSAIGLSLKDPVSPSSTWIFRRVSEFVTISIMPSANKSEQSHQ